jgi:hypothetical protein
MLLRNVGLLPTSILSIGHLLWCRRGCIIMGTEGFSLKVTADPTAVRTPTPNDGQKSWPSRLRATSVTLKTSLWRTRGVVARLVLRKSERRTGTAAILRA